MTPSDLAERLAKHLNDNPLPGQEGRADVIEGENAVGVEIDDELFFFAVQEA
jgi:hypothetical protein